MGEIGGRSRTMFTSEQLAVLGSDQTFVGRSVYQYR